VSSAVSTSKAPAPAPFLGGLISASGLAKALLLAIPFCGLFWFWLWQQHRQSWGSADWSHAYFVPLISIYILWQNKHKFAGIKPELFWPGLLPMLLGIPAYVLFQVGPSANHMGQGWSMLLTLFGLVLLCLGPRLTMHMFLPLAYLAFGVTIAEMIMIRVTFQLQALAAQGSYVLLNMIGVNTMVDGNTLTVIDSTTGAIHPLNVAEACSGMRMVIAFAALGVAVALLAARFWWQRTALLLLAVPVALLMNVVRVAVLGVGSLYNPQFAQGQAHMLIGTLLLVPAFLLYMGIVWALNKAVQVTPEPKRTIKASPSDHRVDWGFVKRASFLVPALVLLVSALGLGTAVKGMGLYLTKKPIQAPGNRQVKSLPPETTSWVKLGQDEVYKEEFVEELGTGNYLSRKYVQKKPPAGKPPIVLNLHLAYYTGMIDTVPHVPERCMTAAGFTLVENLPSASVPLDQSRWELDPTVEGTMAGKIYRQMPDQTHSEAGTKQVRLPLDVQNLTMRVAQFAGKSSASGSKGPTTTIGYFFVANGGLADNAEKIRTLAFRLTDDYAYYMKVEISSGQADNAQELAAQAASLLNELMPEIMRCVPDWVEVEKGTYPEDNPRGRKGK
jgi:exosortase